MKLTDKFFLEGGYNKEDYVVSNFYPYNYIKNKDIFIAGFNAKNEIIQNKIDEIAAELKTITDGSMASGQKRIRLRGQKKLLKELLILE